MLVECDKERPLAGFVDQLRPLLNVLLDHGHRRFLLLSLLVSIDGFLEKLGLLSEGFLKVDEVDGSRVEVSMS